MNFVEKQKFHPTAAGMLVNPYYIIRVRLAEAIRGFAGKAEGRLLDVGCGSMPYRQCFTGVSDYVGLDIEVSGHPDEKKLADAYYDGTVIPFPDNSFDCVLCSEVLEHVFNLEELLAEIKRVLKPGGLAFFTVPFAFPEHEAPFDFGRYTSFGLRSVMKCSEFEVISCEKSGSMIHAIGQLICCYVFERTKSSKILMFLAQIGINSIVTVSTEILGVILPKDTRYFCNLFLTAKVT